VVVEGAFQAHPGLAVRRSAVSVRAARTRMTSVGSASAIAVTMR
jgi:hypothetical protein